MDNFLIIDRVTLNISVEYYHVKHCTHNIQNTRFLSNLEVNF